jgi:hypothetical protein
VGLIVKRRIGAWPTRHTNSYSGFVVGTYVFTAIGQLCSLRAEVATLAAER